MRGSCYDARETYFPFLELALVSGSPYDSRSMNIDQSIHEETFANQSPNPDSSESLGVDPNGSPPRSIVKGMCLKCAQEIHCWWGDWLGCIIDPHQGKIPTNEGPYVYI